MWTENLQRSGRALSFFPQPNAPKICVLQYRYTNTKKNLPCGQLAKAAAIEMKKKEKKEKEKKKDNQHKLKKAMAIAIGLMCYETEFSKGSWRLGMRHLTNVGR